MADADTKHGGEDVYQGVLWGPRPRQDERGRVRPGATQLTGRGVLEL